MPTSPTVVGLGEILWDEFENDRRPGGAPANVAFHARQLGCHAVVCSRVGDDDAGRELLKFLAERGLSTDFIQVDPQLPTGRVTVDSSEPGSPEFIIHENVAWDAIRFDETTRSLIARADAVCFGTLAQRAQDARSTIQTILENCPAGCLRVFDVNLRQNWYSRETIEFSLRHADLLKLNTAEVAKLSSLFSLESDSLTTFCNAVRERFEIGRVCVTRAEHGCLANDEQGTVEVPGADVHVVDAVGAGDALTAALIFATLSGWPLDATARFANAVGSLKTTRAGAMPDLRAEFADLIAEHRP